MMLPPRQNGLKRARALMGEADAGAAALLGAQPVLDGPSALGDQSLDDAQPKLDMQTAEGGKCEPARAQPHIAVPSSTLASSVKKAQPHQYTPAPTVSAASSNSDGHTVPLPSGPLVSTTAHYRPASCVPSDDDVSDEVMLMALAMGTTPRPSRSVSPTVPVAIPTLEPIQHVRCDFQYITGLPLVLEADADTILNLFVIRGRIGAAAILSCFRRCDSMPPLTKPVALQRPPVDVKAKWISFWSQMGGSEPNDSR